MKTEIKLIEGDTYVLYVDHNPKTVARRLRRAKLRGGMASFDSVVPDTKTIVNPKNVSAVVGDA